MTPLTSLRDNLVAILDHLIAEHDREHAEARWPQAASPERPTGETPDPTWRTTAAPDPTNQRRADHIATTIRNAYGLLQDCANEDARRAMEQARREGLCINCRTAPADGRTIRCGACHKYFQRNDRERPQHLWNMRSA